MLRRDQIVHDQGHAVFVKGSVVAPARQVQGFAFHPLFRRQVADPASGGAFRAEKTHSILVVRVFVGKRLERFARGDLWPSRRGGGRVQVGDFFASAHAGFFVIVDGLQITGQRIIAPPRAGAKSWHQLRSSSLMLVLARVFASTCLMITAQDRLCEPSAAGRLPGTTTAPAGTRPRVISPVSRL